MYLKLRWKLIMFGLSLQPMFLLFNWYFRRNQNNLLKEDALPFLQIASTSALGLKYGINPADIVKNKYSRVCSCQTAKPFHSSFYCRLLAPAQKEWFLGLIFSFSVYKDAKMPKMIDSLFLNDWGRIGESLYFQMVLDKILHPRRREET